MDYIIPVLDGCGISPSSNIAPKCSLESKASVGAYKARLVAKGFRQRPELDFHETFAPIAKIQAFRILLVLVALHK